MIMVRNGGQCFVLGIACHAAAGSAQTSTAASALPAPVAPPMSVEIVVPNADDKILRAGTEVSMRTLAELNSKINRQGDRFDLVVTEDVLVGPYVVIPKGARGIGEITRLVPKGAFGKSGKLELSLLYVEAGKARVRLDGRASDRGKSGTTATVVTAVLAGVFSAFVTGKSAKLPAGSTLIGYIERDLPLALRSVPNEPASVPASHAQSSQ